MISQTRSTWIAGLILAALTASAAALTPQEVLVVANARLPESVELAETYARLRNIPATNIVKLKTTKAYGISRVGYDKRIALPLRQAMLERKIAPQIRCIALMWGVPVRVSGPVSTPAGRKPSPHPASALYTTAASRAHYRLASDRLLMGSICRDFPKPKTDRFRPLGDLFEGPARTPAPPLMTHEKLIEDIAFVSQLKQEQLQKIDSPDKQMIASRQLMALHLDIGGVRGLIAFIEKANPPGAPSTDNLRKVLAKAEEKLKEMESAKIDKAKANEHLKLLDAIGGASLIYTSASAIVGEPKETSKKSKVKKKPMERIRSAADASVDSELALLWWPKYDLKGVSLNPLFWRMQTQLRGKKIPPTLMTARIDGPSSIDAMRIIKTSVAVEKTGLKGTFYIDAGGKVPDYDKHLKLLYSLVRKNTQFPAVYDNKKAVFQKNTCPQAALYVGWYSLRRYVPAFMWSEGAVGWHIASFEATDLRKPDSRQWCVKMIQNGVTATIGAVAEPLLGAFPNPEEFFLLLMTGKFTLAECYWRTTPNASWRMTLIGDPLYNPFRANPQIGLEKLPKGLAPQI